MEKLDLGCNSNGCFFIFLLVLLSVGYLLAIYLYFYLFGKNVDKKIDNEYRNMFNEAFERIIEKKRIKNNLINTIRKAEFYQFQWKIFKKVYEKIFKNPNEKDKINV